MKSKSINNISLLVCFGQHKKYIHSSLRSGNPHTFTIKRDQNKHKTKHANNLRPAKA